MTLHIRATKKNLLFDAVTIGKVFLPTNFSVKEIEKSFRHIWTIPVVSKSTSCECFYC